MFSRDWRFFAVLLSLWFVAWPTTVQAELPRVVLSTLAEASSEAVQSGAKQLSPGQQALLVQYNAEINRARMNGWITDNMYQAGQNVYSDISARHAESAGRGVKAEFTIQQSNRRTYMPGTDSDYIYRLDPNSADPVGDVRRMQGSYNEGINEFIQSSLDNDPKVRGAMEAEGIRFQPRKDWHRSLDVDFMADPSTVNQSQFEEIAKLNNDAYTRREAAEFERVSRAKDGTRVPPEMYTAYVEEMEDFIKKKRAKMEKIRANPELLSNPDELADFQRMMAQEQKYINRIESTNAHLRTQEGLGPPIRPQASSSYVVEYDANGNAVIRQRSESTLAARGANRNPNARGTTKVGSNLGVFSENRALLELGESMAEAARRNPAKWAGAAEDIAKLVDHLPPADKGRLIESIKLQSGSDVARRVAEAMRERARPSGVRAALSSASAQLDEALRSALGVSDDLSQMGRFRRGFNEAAGKALGGMENLSRGAVALEVGLAASSLGDYIHHVMKAMDPDTPNDEADEHFRKAMEAAKQLKTQAAMGILFEAVPTTGVVFLGWTIGYDGTNYILTNTQTGEQFNRGVLDYFDRNKQASEAAWNDIQEWLGEESSRSRSADQIANVEASLIEAIRSGRVVLKPGVSVKDVIDLIRAGDILGAHDLIQQVNEDNAQQILDLLQRELFALYHLAGKVNADHELLNSELLQARQQQTIANSHLSIAEDLSEKLNQVAANCDKLEALRAELAEASEGAGKLSKVLNTNLDAIDRRAKAARTDREKSQVVEAFEAAQVAAGKVGAAARQAKRLNEQLVETIQAAIDAAALNRRALVTLDQGLDAVQAGTGSCLRIDSIVPRHAERWQEVEQRKALLAGQVERMRATFAENPEALGQLGGIQRGVYGVNAGPATDAIVAATATARDGLDTIKAAIQALLINLVDPEACGEEIAEDAAVERADQSAYLTALRVAQTKLIIDEMLSRDRPHDPEPVDIGELTEGIRDVPPAEDAPPISIADLLGGIKDRPDQDERVRPPVEEDDPPHEEETSPGVAPPREAEQPIYAVYGVHAYPTPPRDPQQLKAWTKQVFNVNSFQPQARPMGYLAFRVSGEVLQAYRQHQQRVETGQTDEVFELFRPGARYHQTLSSPDGRGGTLSAPLFLSFLQFEEEEPTWVTRTKIGFVESSTFSGSIQSLSDGRSRGSWSMEFQGQQASVGPLLYDAENQWTAATRGEAVAYMKVLFKALEDIFRGFGN